MTRAEWIAWHDNKAVRRGEGVFFERPCTEIFSAENGMIQYVVDGETMVIYEIIGNFSYWEEWILWICRTIGVKKVVCYYEVDDPRTLERLYKTKAVREKDCWRFEREV